MFASDNVISDNFREEAARDWGLPVAAIEEALDYYQRFRDLLMADAVDELALSKELAPRSPLAP